jgi:NAD(P)H-flavin reductase
LNKSESGKSKKNSLPLMLKIYGEGKMTSALRDRSFNVTNLKLSCPRGRGLELDSTSPGRIIVLAGGTGLFPFCDLIDLLYKAHILSENHENRNLILAQSPIL